MWYRQETPSSPNWIERRSASSYPVWMGYFTRNPQPLIPGLVEKFNPNHDPKDGRFTTGNVGRASGNLEGYSKDAKLIDGVIHTSNVEDAVRALSESRQVALAQARQVSTLLDKLAAVAKDMEAKGQQAPTFDLCKVTVKGSSLFCVQSKGIPRIEMPQLKGIPTAGSPASKLKADSRGEVDVTNMFREHLVKKGYGITDADEFASYLKASQNELNGAKVAGIAGAIRAGKLDEQRLFVSKDNYIVDGHHRWAATVGVDSDDGHLGDLKMPVARVNIDIITLLKETNDFADKMGIPQVAVGAKKKKSADCNECGGGTVCFGCIFNWRFSAL